MATPADHQTQRTGQHANEQKLQRVRPGHDRLGHAQHPHQGAVVKTTLSEIARDHGHGHGREQGGQQGHQTQKQGGTVERGTHLRAPLIQGFNPDAAKFLGGLLTVLHESAQSILGCGLTRWSGFQVGGRTYVPTAGRAGNEQAIGDAAGWLDEFGGRQVGLAHQHTGREGAEARAAVRLVDNDRADAEGGLAQPDGVAHLEVERKEQTRVHPDFASRRSPHGCRATGLHTAIGQQIAQGELTTQGVAAADSLKAGEASLPPKVVGCPRHAGETGRACSAQLICLGATRKVVRQRLIGHHHGVPPEQLRRVTAEAALDAVGKESHRGERGDSQGHGHQQHTHAGGTQVTTGLNQGPSPGGNGVEKRIGHVGLYSATHAIER